MVARLENRLPLQRPQIVYSRLTPCCASDKTPLKSWDGVEESNGMPWTALTRVLLSATLFATSLLYLTASQQGRAETCETIFQQGVAHYRQQRFDDAVIA